MNGNLNLRNEIDNEWKENVDAIPGTKGESHLTQHIPYTPVLS